MAKQTDVERMRELFNDIGIPYKYESFQPTENDITAYVLVMYVNNNRTYGLYSRETVYYFDENGEFLEAQLK